MSASICRDTARPTLGDVREAMRQHEQTYAPGDETLQWGYFVDACLEQFGVLPYDEDAAFIEVSEDFARYWQSVAARDYAVAGAYGPVPDTWTRKADPETSAHDEERRQIERIRDATYAADGLLTLQETLLQEAGTGEMPEWWSEYYQGAINLALHACVEKTASAIEWLDER